MFFATIVHLISVRFVLHIFFNSNYRLFESELLISACCAFFAMIVYLISVLLDFIYSLIVISGYFEFELL